MVSTITFHRVPIGRFGSTTAVVERSTSARGACRRANQRCAGSMASAPIRSSWARSRTTSEMSGNRSTERIVSGRTSSSNSMSCNSMWTSIGSSMIVRGRPFGISWNHFDLEPEAGRELLHDEANLTFDLRYLLDIATGLMCRHSDSDPQRPRRVVDVEDVDIVLGEGGGHVGENASTASSALHADREV